MRLRKTSRSDGRFDTDQPWICWWFLSSDRETRITGRSRVDIECCVCGHREVQRIRMPRFGPVTAPKGGRHAERLRFMLDHLHPDRGHPITWAKPLRNLAAHAGGIDVDLLAMRLQADLASEIERA